jgi:hypothetical protein
MGYYMKGEELDFTAGHIPLHSRRYCWSPAQASIGTTQKNKSVRIFYYQVKNHSAQITVNFLFICSRSKVMAKRKKIRSVLEHRGKAK